MSNNTNTNSAAHWCKAVIESAVPTLQNNPAAILTPQTNGTSYSGYYGATTVAATTTTPTTTATAASYLTSLNPAYLQYYQQYYGANAAIASTQNPQSTPLASSAQSAIPR